MKKFEPIVKAAQTGGEILLQYFGQSLTLEKKSTKADFRTKADVQSEAAILKILKKDFPEYNIYSEETGLIDKKNEFTIIIDPMDGTNNFSLGIPYFSVSIALLHKSDTIFACVHYPFLKQTYTAMKNKGSFLNGKKIKVNHEKDISDATVVYACNYQNNQDHYSSDMIKKLNRMKPKRLLNIWSTALDLCLLAAGKIEVLINNESEVYDYIAGKLIAEEAGAIITDFDGCEEKNDRNNRFLVTCNNTIHKKMLKIL